MKPRFLSGLIHSLLCISLLVFSPLTFAVGSRILQQSASTIEMSLASLAVAIVLLLAGLIMFFRKARLADSEIQNMLVQQNEQSALTDAFHLGIVHLSQSGQILFCNRIAAYYLGIKDTETFGTRLTDSLDDTHHSELHKAMDSDVQSSVQLYSNLRERDLRLTFNPLQKQRGDVASILSIEDVSSYQDNINAKTTEIDHLERVIETSQLGQISVNISEDKFQMSPLLSKWLGLEASKGYGTLAQLRDMIHPTDLHAFTQTVSNAENGSEFELPCRFAGTEQTIPTTLWGLPKSPNDKGKYTQLHILASDQRALKAAQSESRLRQQRAKGLLSSTRHPLFVLSPKGEVEECNHAFENMFGIHLSDIRGKNLKDAEFFPEPLKKLIPVNDLQFSAVSSGAAKELELERSEGDVRTLRVKAQGYKDSEGNRAGIVGMIEDITEQKNAIKALAEERAHFTAILDKSPMAIAMIDSNDHVMQANAVMTDRLGMDQEALKKYSFYQLFNDPNRSGKAAKILHQTGQLRNFQAKLTAQDGSLHPSELNIDLFDKEKQQYLCWIADITDQQFHQDKFDDLLEHSSMPMAVMEENGFTHANPAACQFFAAKDQHDLLGLFPYSEHLSEDESSAIELEKTLATIKQDGKAQSMVWQHKVEQERLPCQATYVPMFKGQKLVSILCIWTDLRAINKADQERLEAINLHQAAERQVQQQRQLLEVSQDQLATKSRSLHDAETKLHAAEEDISAKQHEITNLQQENQDVTEHLQKLQNDYSVSRELLANTQRSNEELESQLEQSSVKVSGLEKQRNQIADALQYSERQFQQAKLALQESEKATERLENEQQAHQQEIDQFVGQINQLKGSIVQKDQQINDVSGQIKSLQTQLVSSSEAGEKLKSLLINQRKASEQAELQHRQLEQTYQQAQSDLSLKAQHLEHLQHEMRKFEEMSNQQKGDLKQQQEALTRELEAKQNQLRQTQQALNETKLQAEREKAQREAEQSQQQEKVMQLQQELADVESRTASQQQQMAEANKEFQAQQNALQQELQDKQAQLQQTEQYLTDAKQQTEAEQQEKLRQQAHFEQLKAELKEVEERTLAQQNLMAQSDEQWQAQQQALTEELEAKQRQLQDTQTKLTDNQRQAESERAARQLQQQRVEQLKTELTDVESRATKQKQMMEGSDEQWREHHAEIERQKQQLQQALAQAEQQNMDMQAKLKDSLTELQQAESKMSDSQSGEQQLQQELVKARQEAQQLQSKLSQQEAQESQLQQQLSEQHQALQNREQNIHQLEIEQKDLTEKLQAVQEEYQDSQKDFDQQDNEQSHLAAQLKTLEQDLHTSQQQLDDKEQALQTAQKQLEASQLRLAEKEQALVAAHNEELEQARQQDEVSPPQEIPEFAKLEMPSNPKDCFDLLHYLQQNPNAGPLTDSLGKLIEQFERAIDATDLAVEKYDDNMILFNAKKLVMLIGKLNSATLNDYADRLSADCERGEVDNIAIFWPNVKQSLLVTLRVVYSHLHSQPDLRLVN